MLREILSGSFELSPTRKINTSFGKKTYMEVDCLITPNIVVEYDGVYYHSFEESVRRDLTKTGILLDHGYKVVRFRETVRGKDLPFLDMDSENLLQIHVEFSDSKENLEIATQYMKDWL